MLSISHSLTGALIASKLPHPFLYVPLALGSHYLQDWIPHWDVGTGLSNGKRKKITAVILEIIELAISATLIFYFWKNVEYSNLIHIWAGAFTGLVPDFIEAPRNFLKWEPKFLKPLNEFHNQFHHSTPIIWLGLLPQIMLWIVVWGLR